MKCPVCKEKLDGNYCHKCGEHYCDKCSGQMELIPMQFSEPRYVPPGNIEVDVIETEVLHCRHCEGTNDEVLPGTDSYPPF